MHSSAPAACASISASTLPASAIVFTSQRCQRRSGRTIARISSGSVNASSGALGVANANTVGTRPGVGMCDRVVPAPRVTCR